MRFFVATFIALIAQTASTETLLGTKTISPGISLTFEAAARDTIYPAEQFLDEDQTDVHLEVLASWNQNAPSGFPIGGHVAYLEVDVEIVNEQSGKSRSTRLTPHLNLSDGLHYAQNLKLPGDDDQTYQLTFSINPPVGGSLGIHSDWLQSFGKKLVETQTVVFQSDSLMEATRSRREK
mgnify:CR=1 FL=1